MSFETSLSDTSIPASLSLLSMVEIASEFELMFERSS